MANYELSNLKYKGNTYTIKDNSALHQDSIGSWMPDFANLKPISTHEFNIASTSYYKICERPNVTAIKDIADEVLAFRITVTGTNIFAIADVLVRLQPTVNVRPLVTVNYQTQSTSAATTGIRYLRTVNPKSVNTSYKYEIAIAAYNSTSRHIKVEIFKAPSTWTFASAATVYSYNSTYQTASDLTLYTSIGAFYNYTWYGTASYANYAGYKSVWDALFCNGPGNFIKAGAAIAANQFVFIGKDNKFYPTTSTSVEIDPAWPIAYCTTAHAANADVQWSAIRTWGHVSPASSILKDGTLVAKDTVYMRCTYTNGKLYSANTMTQNLTAGNTYIKLGKMSSATAVVVNTYNSEYFTLDTYGSLTALKALNGYLIEAAKADTASTVSKGGSTAAGTYGVLFDNYPITSVVPTNTSPRVNSNLTFDPSTGNLTSGIFTGSGAGLTDIPLSGIQGGDELLPTKLLHVYHDLDNDTYSFTDSLTPQKIKDILNDASDGAIDLQISIVDVDFSKLLKYYQRGNLFVAKYLLFEDIPAIDMTNYQNHSLQSYFAIVWSAGSDTFQFASIPGDNLATLSQQLMQLLDGKEDLSNKVTAVDSTSTDDQYPSAKAVYDAIHDNDLPSIDTYNGTSKIGYFAVRMLEDGSYTDRYMLDDATHSTANRALSYNRDTNSVNADNGLGWGKRYKIGVKGGFNTNKTNERYIWGGVLRTPITLDHDTKAPLNSLITDGIKMKFRVYGTNQIADGTFIFFDTYVNVCYSASTGWSIYYTCQGAKDYGAALTFEKDYLQIFVGPAASRKTFDEDYANYKRYISMAVYLDHLGSNTSPAAYGDDYCNFIENTSNWAMSVRRGLPTEGWDDVVDQVYMDGWVEGVNLGAKEYISNKVTTIDNTSTDDQYPSAKAVYDAMQSGGSVSKLDLAVDPYYGTCDTAAGVIAKTVTVDSSFQLVDGVRVRVYMSEANTASSATLNVNDTGALSIGFFNPKGEVAYEAISTHTYGFFDSMGWYEFIYVSNYGTGLWMLQDRFSAGALLPSFKLISNYSNSYLSVANSGLRYSIGTATASGGRPFDTVTSVLHMNTKDANQTKELVLSTPTSTSNPAQIAFRSKTNGSWGSWQYALTAPTIDAMPALSYAASGLAFSNKTLTIPINGTKYKLIQVTVFNNDISAGSLGVPALFSFNAAGSSGYMLNTTTYCIATSASTGITLQFDSSWSMATSPNVDVQVLYRRIS